jgi:hypothetical protein
MSEYSGSNVGVADRESPAAVVEIDVKGRWDALALSEILIPYHSFLVQHDDERWVVHARAPGSHGEPLEVALRAIDDWVGEHGLESPSCRVGGRPYQLGESEQT